jgi:hypothetical protein
MLVLGNNSQRMEQISGDVPLRPVMNIGSEEETVSMFLRLLQSLHEKHIFREYPRFM